MAINVVFLHSYWLVHVYFGRYFVTNSNLVDSPKFLIKSLGKYHQIISTYFGNHKHEGEFVVVGVVLGVVGDQLF